MYNNVKELKEMNICKNCKHNKEIAYSHKISCQYFIRNKSKINESPLYKGNIPEYAKSNGWFDFPNSFDPLWISNCEKYKNR